MGAQNIYGPFSGAEADLSHPGLSIHKKTVSLFATNRVFAEKAKLHLPLHFITERIPAEWLGEPENKDKSAIRRPLKPINTVGNGRVINIADNLNFRAFWLAARGCL